MFLVTKPHVPYNRRWVCEPKRRKAEQHNRQTTMVNSIMSNDFQFSDSLWIERQHLSQVVRAIAWIMRVEKMNKERMSNQEILGDMKYWDDAVRYQYFHLSSFTFQLSPEQETNINLRNTRPHEMLARFNQIESQQEILGHSTRYFQISPFTFEPPPWRPARPHVSRHRKRISKLRPHEFRMRCKMAS